MIAPATPGDVDAIEALLSESALPLDGLREHMGAALVALAALAWWIAQAIARKANMGLVMKSAPVPVVLRVVCNGGL